MKKKSKIFLVIYKISKLFGSHYRLFHSCILSDFHKVFSYSFCRTIIIIARCASNNLIQALYAMDRERIKAELNTGTDVILTFFRNCITIPILL